MKKTTLYLFIVLLLASCGNEKAANLSDGIIKETGSSKAAVRSILSNMENSKFKEGELLVKFKAGVSGDTSSSINSAIGSSLIKNLTSVTNLQHVKLSSGMSVNEAIARYMADPNVEYAEPNYIRKPSAVIPNDPFFDPQQWALRNTGTYASGTAGADIKATQAWEISRGTTHVTVAVIDTGIDYTHQDFVGNLWTNPNENPNNGIDDDGNGKIDDWRGWNFVFSDKNGNGICDRFPEDPVQDENCNDPFDEVGHGTHVSGIIGAAGNNGIGISGVMWQVRMMPLKVCFIDDCPIDAIVDAIEYAISKGVRIINTSLSGNVFSSAERDAVAAANAAGILFVASAGNAASNTDLFPSFPAGYPLPNIISVAATDQNDKLAFFSNFGLTSVHVGAPGNYILSSVPLTGVDFSFESLCTGSFFVGYDFCSGTSMAAPHVTGLAGLLYTTYPHFNYSQIRGMILKYVDPLPSLNGFVWTGGRINAFRSLSALLAPTNLAATALSSDKISLSWTDNATGEYGYLIERMVPGGSFVAIASVGPDVTSYTDSGLSASTTYTYRVTASSSLPNPPLGEVHAESGSALASATTLPAGSPPPPSRGGGGGCSIGSIRNAPTAAADTAALLLPLLVITLLRRKK